MLSSVDVERKVFPIIMQCLDGMEQAANSINEKEVNILQFMWRIKKVQSISRGSFVLQMTIINDIDSWSNFPKMWPVMFRVDFINWIALTIYIKKRCR